RAGCPWCNYTPGGCDERPESGVRRHCTSPDSRHISPRRERKACSTPWPSTGLNPRSRHRASYAHHTSTHRPPPLEGVVDGELEDDGIVAPGVELGAALAIEGEAPLEAQRADGRLPAEAEAGAVAKVAQPPGSAGVRLGELLGIGRRAVARLGVE